MLDLNLEIFSGSRQPPSCDHRHDEEENKRNVQGPSKTQTKEDSVTSTSSITNPGNETSCQSGFIISFGILKKDEETTTKDTQNHVPPEYSLNQKNFPVTGEKGFRFSSGPALSGSTEGREWLNLSSWCEDQRTHYSGNGVIKASSNNNDDDDNKYKQQVMRKSRRGPKSRSSPYRGVTFYRRTGRWESHIWDTGRQVYLGGFDTAHAAARAYDRAALKFRGSAADINFDASDYEEDVKLMKHLTKEEFVQSLRRQSSGLPQGRGSRFRAGNFYKCDRLLGSSLNLVPGNGENLELRLGIASGASNKPEIPSREKPMTGKSDAVEFSGAEFPRSIAMAAKHNGFLPGFFSNHLGLAWRKSNDNYDSAMLSSAASSGFSSSSSSSSSCTTGMADHSSRFLCLNSQSNNLVNNRRLWSTMNNNASGYYAA